MTEQAEQASAWVLKSMRVLGTLLYYNEEWFDKAVYGTGLKISDFPPIEHFRVCFETMLAIRKDKNVLISAENVWTYSGRQCDMEWLGNVQAQHDSDLLELVSDAKLVVKLGQRAWRLEKAEAAAAAYRDESKDEEEITKRLIQDMSVMRAVEIRDASAHGIIDRIREELNAGIRTFVTPTGIDWLDKELKGGLRSKRYIALGAREKGRKSTALRNALLGASRVFLHWQEVEGGHLVPIYEAREHVSIALFAFENDQQITIWDFIAMLTYEYLYYRGMDGERFDYERTIGDLCNGEDLQSGFESGDWATWKSENLRDAIVWGVHEAEQLHLYIYDSQPENGGLRTIDDLKRIIAMHRGSIALDDDHLIFALDYAQLVRGSGNMFEDLRETSATGLATATGMRSTFITLTQFNRDTNKSNAKKEDTGDVMGTRGEIGRAHV